MANINSEITQPTETQRAEIVANRFYDMAVKARAEETQYPQEERYKEEVFSVVGREAAQGNFHGAQRLLEERSGVWNDNLRGAASEINQLDQERIGVKPLSFEDAQKTMRAYARDFEKRSKEPGGRQSDLEGAMAIDNIVADTSTLGIAGIDEALKYIEDTLQSKNNVADSILKSKGPTGEQAKEFLKDWQEKRAIRDALYQEKQQRGEQIKQTQRGTEELTKGRGATATRLEQAFTQAGIPEDAASRKEFLGRANAMSAEELHFLDSALNKAAREAMRSGDPKMFEGLLMDLSTKSFKRKDVEQRQKIEDRRKIAEIRVSMGLEGTTEQQSPKPAGRTEEEIEMMRKRVEKMMSSKEPQEKKEAVEPRSLDKAASKRGAGQTEPKIENLFQGFVDSPETYLDQLGGGSEPHTYYPKKAIGAVMEVFQKLYPDKKQRANRIQEIFDQYGTIRDEARKERPSADESSYENFATNQTAQRLSGAERQAIEKIIVDKINSQDPTGTSKFSKELVLGDFIKFLEGIKK